jgi:hypothetical protein
MGCDIHLHVEVKVGGKWLHYNSPTINRDYGLFTKMAGVRVRGDETTRPISQPRGLPPDVSDSTAWVAKYWGTDAHSHSYLSASEMRHLREWARYRRGRYGEGWWFEDTFGYLCGNSLDGLAECPGDYPKDLEDVRFVFWFDS